MILDSDGDTGITPCILLLHSADGCIDQDVLSICINPDGADLWRAISVHCCEEAEVLLAEKVDLVLLELRGQFYRYELFPVCDKDVRFILSRAWVLARWGLDGWGRRGRGPKVGMDRLHS